MEKIGIYAMAIPVVFIGWGLALLENSQPEAIEPAAVATPPPINENDYVDAIAARWGVPEDHVEFVLPDKSRVDILTDSTAWEADWDNKWTEAIGQALFYANSTNRRPGVILLMKSPQAEENYLEALSVIGLLRGHGIPVDLHTERILR